MQGLDNRNVQGKASLGLHVIPETTEQIGLPNPVSVRYISSLVICLHMNILDS